MIMDMKGRVLDEESKLIAIRFLNHLSLRIEFLRGRLHSSGHGVKRRLKRTMKVYEAVKLLTDAESEQDD